MEGYDYALGAEAVHAFTAQGIRGREKLMLIFDQLAKAPFEPGDYQERGLAGRAYEIRLFHDVLVTWWVDHAVKEVRIVRLEWV